MQVSLETERQEQRRWKLRPAYSHLTAFDELIANEFLTADERRQRREKKLSAMLRFAANRVPYYGALFGRIDLQRGAAKRPAEFSRIPLLTKKIIQENRHAFIAKSLPRGVKAGHPLSTSGTTGQKLIIAHTMASHEMWTLAAQRGRRWFRFDPQGIAAAVRSRDVLPRLPDGSMVPDGETVRLSYWPRLGKYFDTGPALGFAKSNPVEHMADWLVKEQPNYFQSDSSVLEHVALALQAHPALKNIHGLGAVSEPLTAGRRALIEKTFAAKISIGYGLNEFGVVANCCPEAGRYHVHDENCLVEIIDEDGNPSAPGSAGRIVVTGLTNFAMPFIRYDTGDVAQRLEGPCPCGRTLPSFGLTLGRRIRIDPLPPDVMALADTVLDAMERLPKKLSAKLRMYQLHHFRGGNFELRIVAAGSLPPAFFKRIEKIWKDATASRPIQLKFTTVENLRPIPSDKFFHFTSDLF
jgi:phenylacetate-CoA ligase